MRSSLLVVQSRDELSEPEAYLWLVGADEQPHWNSRGHFFGAAAQAMRRILVENARRKRSVKHGGGRDRRELQAEEVAAPQPREDLLALDEALSPTTISSSNSNCPREATAASSCELFPQGELSGNQFTEVQLIDNKQFPELAPDRRHGALLNLAAPKTPVEPVLGAWQELRIRIEGQRVQTWIGSTPLLDHTAGDLPARGRIGLQLYPSRIEFRNIRVRDLATP